MGRLGYMQEWHPDGKGSGPSQVRGRHPLRLIFRSVDAPDGQYIHWLVETDPLIHPAEFVLQALNELTAVYPD